MYTHKVAHPWARQPVEALAVAQEALYYYKL